MSGYGLLLIPLAPPESAIIAARQALILLSLPPDHADRPMLEPKSTTLFFLLIAMFGGLMWWLVRTRRLVFRVAAAVPGFVMAMQFGVLAVNRYFGYYQTWGAAAADLTNHGVSQGGTVRESSLLATGSWAGKFDQRRVYLRLAMPNRGREHHASREV